MPENEKSNAETLDFIFKQIGYTFGCGSLMVAGPLVAKYAPKMFTVLTPLVVLSTVSGLLLTLTGFYLAIKVASHGAKEVNRRLKVALKERFMPFFMALWLYKL